jgi:hypothetical protein
MSQLFTTRSQYQISIGELYERFSVSISNIDCGDRCAPYNEGGIPFCCDTHHAIPTAYPDEWKYLSESTDLWHIYTDKDRQKMGKLQKLAPYGQILIECRGHLACQRAFRSFDCRSFPFFPYLTKQGEFIGLSYHWDYQDRCWVISHLNIVTSIFLEQCVASFENIFERYPEEKENYRQYSSLMRRSFGQRHLAIILLHRNGKFYKISPGNGRMRRISVEKLPQYGPYKIAAEMPFPEEIS